MDITRREFCYLAGASLLATALPAERLLAGPVTHKAGSLIEELHPVETVESRVPRRFKAMMLTRTHRVAATNAVIITDGFTNIGFGPASKHRAGRPAVCPSGGKMSVTIDKDGILTFTGSFIGQPLPEPCTVAMGIGLRSSKGQVVVITELGIVSEGSFSFNKGGPRPAIRNMWKDIAAGHDFIGCCIAHQIPETNHQPSEANFKSNLPDVGEVERTLTKLLGPATVIN